MLLRPLQTHLKYITLPRSEHVHHIIIHHIREYDDDDIPWIRVPVETKSHGTEVPSSSRKPILRRYESKRKNVSWRDALFPRHPTQIGSRSLQSSTHGKVESFAS
jgi:hypothetical protein